jgi:hypothetical protein
MVAILLTVPLVRASLRCVVIMLPIAKTCIAAARMDLKAARIQLLLPLRTLVTTRSYIFLKNTSRKYRRKSMNGAQIERYLGFLGQKLDEMQTKATIILLGGALMVTQIGNRKSTQDIDVVIATNDRRTYQTIQQAIQLVAKEKKLSSSWMNDDVTIIIDQIGKPKSPRPWKTFSSLTVYIPELEYILALKLFSGRPQDDRDIQALSQRLHIHTKEQAWSIVNVYIPSSQLGIRGGYTTQAIDRCFTK